MSQPAQVSVKAWKSDGILLEKYAYTSGAVTPLPKHAHSAYQLGWSFDCLGEYTYRGACHTVPTQSLSVIHSGEVHAPSDRTSLPSPAHFLMAHIEPGLLSAVAAEMAERPTAEPFFPETAIADDTLGHLFLALQAAAYRQASQLERDISLWNFLAYLIGRHATGCPAAKATKSVRAAVVRSRDYLHAHVADDVSLEELAAVANLSRFHFCRVFSKAVGLSPSAYQTQLRIDRARVLLAQGLPIATVASMTGFYDQSHLSWHFKRRVGVTPGNYCAGPGA